MNCRASFHLIITALSSFFVKKKQSYQISCLVEKTVLPTVADIQVEKHKQWDSITFAFFDFKTPAFMPSLANKQNFCLIRCILNTKILNPNSRVLDFESLPYDFYPWPLSVTFCTHTSVKMAQLDSRFTSESVSQSLITFPLQAEKELEVVKE